MYKYQLKGTEEKCVWICFAILCSFVVVPQFKVLFPMTIIYLGIIAVLTVVMLRQSKKWSEWLYLVIAVFYSVYTAIVPMVFGYRDLANRYIALVPMVWLYALYEYLKKNRAIDGVWKLMILFAVITMLRTSQALLTSPYISRMVKSSGEFSESILLQGIGDYSFIYALVLMNVLFFWLFLEKKGKKKLVYLFLVISSEGTILLSNYMMALLLSLFGIAVLTAFWIYRKNKAVFFVLLMIFAILLLFSKPLLYVTLDGILAVLPDGKTYDRLLQMQMSLYGEGKGLFEEFASDRIPVLSISLKSIKAYPAFGVICGHLTKTDGYYNEFGQHSYIFDTMALYGIGISLILLFLLTFPFFTEGRMRGKKKELSIAIFLIMLLLVSNNNATFSIAVMLYVIYPYICDGIGQEGEEKYA